MLECLKKLPQLGEEPAHFYRLLKPVLTRFVRTPESRDIVEFWSKIAHQTGGSGVKDLSSWMTAFCFCNSEGVCMSGSKMGVDVGTGQGFASTQRSTMYLTCLKCRMVLRLCQ